MSVCRRELLVAGTGAAAALAVITAPIANPGSIHAKLEAPVAKGTALAGTPTIKSITRDHVAPAELDA